MKRKKAETEQHFYRGCQQLRQLIATTNNEEHRTALENCLNAFEQSELPYDEFMRQYEETVMGRQKKASLRKGPVLEATHIIPLPENEQYGAAASIIRVNPTWIDGQKQDPDKFYRRMPVSITCPRTRRKIVRMVLGGGGIAGLNRDAVVMDYDSKDQLNAENEDTLIITRATPFEVYAYYWHHPDVGYQVAMRLGIIGVISGIAGLFISIVSLVL